MKTNSIFSFLTILLAIIVFHSFGQEINNNEIQCKVDKLKMQQKYKTDSIKWKFEKEILLLEKHCQYSIDSIEIFQMRKIDSLESLCSEAKRKYNEENDKKLKDSLLLNYEKLNAFEKEYRFYSMKLEIETAKYRLDKLKVKEKCSNKTTQFKSIEKEVLFVIEKEFNREISELENQINIEKTANNP